MYKLGFGWKVERKTKRVVKQILPKLKTLNYLYNEVYSFTYRQQNLMKILNETRHQELSNYINYKAIISVLTEIYIFEISPRFLLLVLTRLGFVGHNSPYTTSNRVQKILLGR